MTISAHLHLRDIPSKQVKLQPGQPLTQPLTDPARAADRAAMTRNARYRTRAPKGVFFYASHEEMAADRLRWTIDLMVERAQAAADQAR